MIYSNFLKIYKSVRISGNTRSLLWLFLFFIFWMESNAQESVVLSWVQQHPEVALIEHSDFPNFTSEDLGKLQGGYIVFTDQLTQNDIDKFMEAQPEVSEVDSDFEADKDLVKTWLYAHPEVKIVKKSEFILAHPNDQEMYIKDTFVMVLKGEVVRKADIDKYLAEKG